MQTPKIKIGFEKLLCTVQSIEILSPRKEDNCGTLLSTLGTELRESMSPSSQAPSSSSFAVRAVPDQNLTLQAGGSGGDKDTW